MLLERIYCKYHNRQKVKAAIDDNLPVIVTNWCLIHTGELQTALKGGSFGFQPSGLVRSGIGRDI